MENNAAKIVTIANAVSKAELAEVAPYLRWAVLNKTTKEKLVESQVLAGILEVRMDRKIDTKNHYILPGMMEITFEDGTVIPVDFLDVRCLAVQNDRIQFFMFVPDVENFPVSSCLAYYLKNSTVTSASAFIYCGDQPEDAEIHPVEIRELTFSIDAFASRVSVPKEILKNVCLAD